jgi:hypothetical protein
VCCSTTHAGHKFQSLKTFTEVLEKQAKVDLVKLAKNPKASNVIESPDKKNSKTSVIPDNKKLKSAKSFDPPEVPKKKRLTVCKKDYKYDSIAELEEEVNKLTKYISMLIYLIFNFRDTGY